MNVSLLPTTLPKAVGSGFRFSGLALIVVLTGCAAGRPMPPTGATPGTWRVEAGTLKNGARRSYLLHVPAEYRQLGTTPLS